MRLATTNIKPLPAFLSPQVNVSQRTARSSDLSRRRSRVERRNYKITRMSRPSSAPQAFQNQNVMPPRTTGPFPHQRRPGFNHTQRSRHTSFVPRTFAMPPRTFKHPPARSHLESGSSESKGVASYRSFRSHNNGNMHLVRDHLRWDISAEQREQERARQASLGMSQVTPPCGESNDVMEWAYDKEYFKTLGYTPTEAQAEEYVHSLGLLDESSYQFWSNLDLNGTNHTIPDDDMDFGFDDDC